MNFGEFLWGLLIVFLMINYFIILFSVVVDIFRDRDSSGWVKAAWIVGLVFFPFLSLLIYVIVNARGMASRNVSAAQQVPAAQDAYVREVAGTSPADQIAKAKDLQAAGTISQAEFEQLKAKALAS